MSEIKIEKKIPLGGGKARGALRITLEKMEIGDSFLYKKNSAVHTTAAFAKIRVAVRSEGKNQIRIWRIA